MTPDELANLEAELKKREDAVAAREADLARLAEGKGTDADALASPAITPNPTTKNTQPSPSTFVHSIKTYVPITLVILLFPTFVGSHNHVRWLFIPEKKILPLVFLVVAL
jgi:hypothetical protein